jgi:hypothetical protein
MRNLGAKRKDLQRTPRKSRAKTNRPPGNKNLSIARRTAEDSTKKYSRSNSRTKGKIGSTHEIQN